ISLKCDLSSYVCSSDLQWGRLLAQHMGKHIPGKPELIVQNMPGAGHMIAANYVYNRTKPDGLSLIGSIVPTLYFDQLVGRKEARSEERRKVDECRNVVF